jgi:hypothetical protein
MLGDPSEHFAHERIRRGDAARERVVRIRFDEDGDAPAKTVIVGSEPRATVVRLPCDARRRVRIEHVDLRAGAREVAVGEHVDAMGRLHAPPDVLEQRAPEGVGRDRRLAQRRSIRQRVPVQTAVGRVQIDEHVRVPFAKSGERRARFVRLRLHVIAVQVEPFGVGTLPDELRPVLLRALAFLGTDSLVAVGVVDGDGDEHEVVEHVLVGREREIAHQRQDRLFAFDLTRVDVRLHVHDGAAERAGFRRRAHERTRRHHVRNVPPLARSSQGRDVHRGAALRKGSQESDDVLVARGFGVSRSFGSCSWPLHAPSLARACRRAARRDEDEHGHDERASQAPGNLRESPPGREPFAVSYTDRRRSRRCPTDNRPRPARTPAC